MDAPEIHLVVDTREQATLKALSRIGSVGLPVERRKLDAGDYSAEMVEGDTHYCYDAVFTIERKMSLDELEACFTRGRDRFRREFERAANKGTRVYLLIEGENLDKMIHGLYRSKMNPDSFVNSFFAWEAEFGFIPVFISQNNSGRIIRSIVRWEVTKYNDQNDYHELPKRRDQVDSDKTDM